MKLFLEDKRQHFFLVTPWEFGTKLKNKKRQMDPQLSLVCLDSDWKLKGSIEASTTSSVLTTLPSHSGSFDEFCYHFKFTYD